MSLADPARLRVRHLDLDDPAGCARWDAAVRAHPDATVFHLTAWSRAVAQAYGHRVWMLYVERDGVIDGLLPLTLINSLLFGKRLISTAFAVYGGPLADSPETHAALDAEATGIQASCGAEALEYRNRQRLRPDWPAKTDIYATFRKPVDPDPEVNMLSLPRKRRAMVRKGQAAELQAEEVAHVDRVWLSYAESVRNLGTPVFPRRWFVALKQQFGDDCVLQLVTKDGVVHAGGLSLIFRDELHFFYFGGTREGREWAVNDFLFWSVMEATRTRGLRLFDMGRSKVGTGAYDFKVNWGIEPEPLAYEFHLAPGAHMPDMNPNSPKYQRFVQMWSRLPLEIANLAGPLLARSLG